METKDIQVVITESNEIILELSPEDKINIATNGDIDFTEYVNKLFSLIDNNIILVISPINTENIKLKLIHKTITDIAEAFNECVTDEHM